jgi:hypothetical protein
MGANNFDSGSIRDIVGIRRVAQEIPRDEDIPANIRWEDSPDPRNGRDEKQLQSDVCSAVAAPARNGH